METTNFNFYATEYGNVSDYNSTIYEDYSYSVPGHHVCFEEVLCVLLLTVNIITFVLGVVGNGVVIWIAGFKMKKTVNTTWYLSLALSDFVFCASLPFNTAYMVTSDWTFGYLMCKLTSFVMFLNMFGSISLLVVISVDRCVTVMFPVWAQNQRTIRKASVVVLLAWLASVVLSVPSLIFRDTKEHLDRTRCQNDYTGSPHTHQAVATSRFVFGFLLPFLVIIVCYSVIIVKLRSNQIAKSTKPFKIMTALIVTFFLCWLPYHVFVLVELNRSLPNDVMSYGLQIGTSVASANSFLNPVLYVFMGNDFRRRFKSSVLTRIESAMGEEGRTLSRYLSRSSSVDTRASTHI